MESFREDCANCERRDSRTAGCVKSLIRRESLPSFLVFVIEKMAVKDGHAPDDGLGEIHNDVDGTAERNIYGV